MKNIILLFLMNAFAFGLAAQTCADGNASNGQPAARFIGNGQFYLEWSTDAAAMGVFAMLNSTGSINYNGEQIGTGVMVNQTVGYADLRNPGGNPFRIRTNVPIAGIAGGGTFSGVVTMTFDDGSILACEYSSGNLLGALPIELSMFSAKEEGKQIMLEWVTSSEANSDYISIERSRDGQFFQEIGIVKGAGNSNSPTNYSFMDSAPYKGTSYYRLKQTDFDRSVSLSDLISVKLKGEDGFSVQPSLIDNLLQTNIDLTAYDNETIDLFVTNLAGYVLLNKSIRGGSIISLDVSELDAGMHFVHLNDGQNLYTQRITVVK